MDLSKDLYCVWKENQENCKEFFFIKIGNAACIYLLEINICMYMYIDFTFPLEFLEDSNNNIKADTESEIHQNPLCLSFMYLLFPPEILLYCIVADPEILKRVR